MRDTVLMLFLIVGYLAFGLPLVFVLAYWWFNFLWTTFRM